MKAVLKKTMKWAMAVVALLVLVLAVALFAAHRWLGTDDFRSRVAHEASTTLGVEVSLQKIDIALWPLPALAISDILVKTPVPLRLARLELRPVWVDLLQGHLAPATLVLRGAHLPQPGLEALLNAFEKVKKKTTQPATNTTASPTMAAFLPRRTVLDGITWVDTKNVATTLQGDFRLGPDGLPDTVALQIIQGRLQGSKLDVQRDSKAWKVKAQVGGGSIVGHIDWQAAPVTGGPMLFKGKLQTQGVEVAALLQGVSAGKAPLSGRLEASTTLSASTPSLGLLADALQTQSQCTVHQAVLHGIDLAKAVKTAGISRGGETRLDTLTGQVQTQGKSVQLNNLVASSGLLNASGKAAVSPSQALSGRIKVDLAGSGGTVGVPLVLSGTVQNPEVTLTRGAMIGAAVGTLLAPGVGTGAGASVGDKVGEKLKNLFGR